MTASDPRVGEIAARLAEVTNLGLWETTRSNDVVIYAPNGFGAYRLVAHADAKQDAEFIAGAREDVAYLLAQLRDRDAKLARVLDACDRIIDNTDGHKPPGPPHPTREQATACRIRAAVAAATGGGDQ